MGRGKNQYIHQMVIYFAAVIGLLLSIMLLTRTSAVPVDSAQELKGFDYASDIAYLSAACFDWYPGELYSPGDFAAGGTVSPAPVKNDKTHHYYTYRLLLNLEPDQVYGLSAYSATYAQTIWIDGVLSSAVGTPGDSLETTEPKTSYFTIYFKSRGETEIVIQRADFVHAAGGQLYPQYLGRQDLIAGLHDGIKVRGALIVGAMLMAMLFFFGIFLFFRRRRQFLWFALTCLCVAVRTLFTDHKLIMVLFPQLPWRLSHKVEYVFTIGLYLFVFLYLNRMFRRKIPGPVNGVFYALCGAAFLMTVFTPSTVYTRALPVLQVCCLLYALLAVFFLVRGMLRDAESRHVEHITILAGAVSAVVFALLDMIRYMRYEDLNLLQMGITVFVFANTLALALSFTRTETQLSEARRNEREMEEANRMLERLNRVKSEFLSNISHEIRTPLTVMSGYAQRARRQIEAGTAGEDARQGLLTVSLEARRLALLAQQLLDTTEPPVGAELSEPVDAAGLFRRAADLGEPILRKNGNRLSLHTEPGLPPVYANESMILQVLVNLCVNAGRHTRDGRVTMRAGREGDMAVFHVEDDGEGIDPAILPHIFERSVSGDGASGLGLAICREVVEAHGGAISAASAPGSGTRIRFTLPLYREDGGRTP